MAKCEELYFIVRSYLMSLIGAVLFPAMVFILHSIDFIQAIIIGFFVYVASLVISKAFDRQIGKLTNKIVKHLDRNKKIKNLILKYF